MITVVVLIRLAGETSLTSKQQLEGGERVSHVGL